MKKSQTRRLVESGALIAIGFILSFFKVEIFPGTSISAISMLPVILLAYKYGTSWGLLCGLVHGVLQMVEGGIDTPPTENILSYVAVVLLDYLLAFSAIGLAGAVRNLVKNPSASISICCAVGVLARGICSFLSGAIIWGVYAPEGQSAWAYSAVINGTKFGVEGAVTIIVAAALLAFPIMQESLKPVGISKKELQNG